MADVPNRLTFSAARRLFGILTGESLRKVVRAEEFRLVEFSF